MNKESIATVNKLSSSYKITCTGFGWQKNNSACNNTFYISVEDVKLKKTKDKSGKIVNFYGITCPICGCFTIISRSEFKNKN